MKLKNICRNILAVSVLGLMSASCSDKLDLSPEDYYSNSNFWQKESQAISFVDGMHSSLRDKAFDLVFRMGEFRGGILRQSATGADGMTISYGLLVNNNLAEDRPEINNYANIYGNITNINLFLSRIKDATYISDARKNYLMGQAYGLRAYYYFHLYRTWGTAPIRLGTEVLDGILDPNVLYAKEVTAKEVMDQIKDDLNKSLEHFGTQRTFDFFGKGTRKSNWSLAATEMLMGEVYLWASKVTTGDFTADEANLATAKRHLESVVANYNLGLMPNFGDIFEAKDNKGNREVILAVRYAEGEATNSLGAFTYSMNTGFTKNDFKADGSVFGDALQLQNTGNQSLEYRLGLFESYEAGDTRRDATFIASYKKRDDGSLTIHGTHVRKNLGYINAQGNRILCGDYVLYRLADAYLMLAEIANMQGDNAKVKENIDIVRRRAFGTNWNAVTHGFTTGSFTDNELAILAERNKEFVQEGKRWYDLRRMQLTKGGKHLVFAQEAAIKDYTWNATAKILQELTTKPVLDEATEAHEVLWPVNQVLLRNEKFLYQNPGYVTEKKRP